MIRVFAAIGLGVFLFAIPSFTAAQSPPEGFKSFESKGKGLFLFLPGRFEELPVPPDEDLIQLKFTEKQSIRNEGEFRPEMWIFQIPKKSITTGESSSVTPASPKEDEEEKEASKPKPGEKPEIYSIEDFFAKRVKDWDLKADGSVARGKESPLARYTVKRKKSEMRGVVFVHDLPDRSLSLVGFALSSQMADYQKLFEKSAKSLKLKDTGDSLAKSIASYYSTRPYRGLDYRTQVRMNLPTGWKADDTENYILIYSTKDPYVIAKIKNDIEAVRTKYVEMFPSVKPIEAVSTVRVCKDQEEFQKFAGVPPYVAGFWNSASEELVFFDYDFSADNKRSVNGNKNAYIVLYHEAFHQYIHYSCGELAPHSWFGEGWGDYFSGSVVGRGGKKVDRMEPNPWRIKPIKYFIDKNEIAPLKDLVRFEQKDYYQKGAIYYPQGWSFIYFLNESKVAKKHPVWSKISDTYFGTLQSLYKEELDEAAKSGKTLDPESLGKVQLKVRKAAVEVAFKDVDYDDLEREWIQFTMKLKDP